MDQIMFAAHLFPLLVFCCGAIAAVIKRAEWKRHQNYRLSLVWLAFAIIGFGAWFVADCLRLQHKPVDIVFAVRMIGTTFVLMWGVAHWIMTKRGMEMRSKANIKLS